MIIGTLSLVWFIFRQYKLEHPILEFKVFENMVFTITTVLSMVVFFVIIGGAIILPMFMQNMLGFTAFKSGLMLLPGALLMGLMSPIAGRLFDKFGARWLSIIGLLILVISSFMFANLNEQTTFTYLTVVNSLRMLSVGMVLMHCILLFLIC